MQILQQDVEGRFVRNCRATKSVNKRTFVKAAKPAGGVLRGHARVSKVDEQNNALQTKALRAAGCRRLFEATASGGRWDRPELHRLLDHLREGDTVVVWKLDRLLRSLERVAHHGADRQCGRGFPVDHREHRHDHPGGADGDADGRGLCRIRTCNDPCAHVGGLAAARAEGRVGGRRMKLDPAKRREIAQSVIAGRKSAADMARLYNVNQPTVSRIVAQHRGETPTTGLST